MTTYDWPTEWYKFSSSTFHIVSRSQVTPRTWTGGKSVYGPHAQLWTSQFSIVPQLQDDQGQLIQSFFSRLDGQANLLRIGDPVRRTPQYNRLLFIGNESWSDGTYFTDGTGWESADLLPANCFLNVAASRGDNYIVIGGLPASLTRPLRPGDLIELRASGIATDLPCLHEIVSNNNSDASGVAGYEIRPRLRRDFAAGDMVVLNEPRSTFRLIDDEQGAAAVTPPVILDMSFTIVENI